MQTINGKRGNVIMGPDGSQAGIDASTETIRTITYEHHEIHSGSHYNYCDYALGLANNATIEFFITVADTAKWPHVVFEFSASEGATIDLYIGTSGVSGGTTITPRNNNGNSANTAGMTIVKDPATITSDGTKVAGFLAGGGRTAGFASRDKENVLQQAQTYLIRMTSLAVSNDISWCGEWYEHTDKN